ncbi:MAG: ribonuclease H-like domain-containing protein [Christensenellales bacterium]|jgi:uncharacterized protein YprB with RNaseH-like and TPR domain
MNLRDRLRAISHQQPKKPVRLHSGLVVRESLEEMPPMPLDAQGLSRMGFDDTSIGNAIYLDTETTGLSGGVGTLAFMVGIGRREGNLFHITQYMLSDYSDEAEMLRIVAESLRRADTVVTFNGRAFDMPLLASRYTLLREEEPFPEARQLDLLFPARRLYKRRLGSCRFSVLEEALLDMGREDDLPGSVAPKRFFDYLKTGDSAPLEDVLRHNRQDVLSMPYLLNVLCAAYADPAGQEHRLDLYSMGRAMERLGQREQAKACFLLAGQSVPKTSIENLRAQSLVADANRALSGIYRREGDLENAERIWRMMVDKGYAGIMPYVELSKLFEHRKKDCGAALKYAETALAKARAHEKDEIGRRIARLRAKIEKGDGKT